MIIYFVETESEERQYYGEQFPEDELYFVAKGEEVQSHAEVVSLFIGTRVDRAFLERLPSLRLIATRSRAVDHLDLAACQERGVTVCHVADYSENTVAEHTFALMLALTRRLRELMIFAQTKKKFSYEDARATDLCGKTLGIIGMGRVGRRVCTLAQAFLMNVVAFEPAGMPPAAAEKGGWRWLPLKELLGVSDIVSLHVNLSPWTHHMLNAETFALCKWGALIINTARGRLIETDALRAALDSGQIRGAGLDVLEEERVMRQPASTVMTEQILQHLHSDSEQVPTHRNLHDLDRIMQSDALLARPNVVFTPHVAFNSTEAVEKIALETVRNVQAFVKGAPVNVVTGTVPVSFSMA
ncbi:MAG TPA: NAD(P)-dependent oxidoreductase [Chthoniobacteraceae bacterium]|nr:NAD(P)-dependent oxidoreductase [Chthoniobacteraceae bacterium]